MKSTFHQIAILSGTDKVSHHFYHHFYPKFLEQFRDSTGDMLEIGIDKHFSLKLWKEYFPKFNIYGIDIGIEMIHDRGEIFKCDQSNLEDVARVTNPLKNMKLIIDDGSHLPEHQILTFNYLFNNVLKNSGVYIIEDIETSYWRHGNLYGYEVKSGMKNRNSTIELFKNIIDYINKEFLGRTDKEILSAEIDDRICKETLNAISSVTFGQNCIIIVKKSDQEINMDRNYRFAPFVEPI